MLITIFSRHRDLTTHKNCSVFSTVFFRVKLRVRCMYIYKLIIYREKKQRGGFIYREFQLKKYVRSLFSAMVQLLMFVHTQQSLLPIYRKYKSIYIQTLIIYNITLLQVIQKYERVEALFCMLRNHMLDCSNISTMGYVYMQTVVLY